MIQHLKVKNRLTIQHTQEYRKSFALNRNAAGFSKEMKEFVYTLVCDRTDGPYVYDIDGNQYIDLTMGFGSVLFGHNYIPIRKAIEEQLTKSWSVGPISPLAGILSKEISKATGVERAAFFNSGTEAIMVALRIAKAVTRKKYIVFFKGSYHGTYDSLLSLKNDPITNLAKEILPGVTQSVLNESYLLTYGSEASLDFIKEHKNEIAAVLTEPVQSRNPIFQPSKYLHELRKITEENDIALIFDEVITGFRLGIGGAQKHFGITADIVTYGKVIGGGLPIGVVAGKAKYLDATDGGFWKYGDDSVPAVKPTFVAGTFCHHPLAMAASLKTLEILNHSDGKLLDSLNKTTAAFCNRLNTFFIENGYPVSINHFASLFRFITPGKSNLLYFQLLLNGVYVWEGRNCFLSPAHTPEVLEVLEEKIKLSCLQLEELGILKKKSVSKPFILKNTDQMNKKLILQDGEYSIWRHEGIPNEALEFLDRIAWGNDGAVYEHKNTEEHIRLLHRPTLMAINEYDKIQGTAVFCNTAVAVGAAQFNCFYIRYFASSKEIRGKGVMKKYGIKVMESVREDEKEKTIFFACIEKGNKASYRTVESAGYENIGVIKTNGFSRYFPRANKNMERVTTDVVRKEVLHLLQKQYKEHAMVQFNSIFLNDDYFIIRENGEIVAGCQFHRVHWVINNMPGLMGKIVMNIVPLIPVLNKLFNPKQFEFLAFEGIYVKPGFENKLTDLFEGILAKEKLKSSMFWLGESCPLRKRILEKCKTGLIHSFIKKSDVFIMTAFHDLNEEEITDLKSRPLFVSGFDYI